MFTKFTIVVVRASAPESIAAKASFKPVALF